MVDDSWKGAVERVFIFTGVYCLSEYDCLLGQDMSIGAIGLFETENDLND